jgi:hypothetical protein
VPVAPVAAAKQSTPFLTAESAVPVAPVAAAKQPTPFLTAGPGVPVAPAPYPSYSISASSSTDFDFSAASVPAAAAPSPLWSPPVPTGPQHRSRPIAPTRQHSTLHTPATVQVTPHHGRRCGLVVDMGDLQISVLDRRGGQLVFAGVVVVESLGADGSVMCPAGCGGGTVELVAGSAQAAGIALADGSSPADSDSAATGESVGAPGRPQGSEDMMPLRVAMELDLQFLPVSVERSCTGLVVVLGVGLVLSL